SPVDERSPSSVQPPADERPLNAVQPAVDELPLTAKPAQVPGFIESAFPPLVYQMIRSHMDSGNVRDPARLAIVLASALGDTGTSDRASRNLLAGQVHNPLLFYQSVPNSILGYAARQYGLTGLMTTLAHAGDGLSALLEMAMLYSELPDVEQVLVIGVELRSDRADELLAELTEGDAMRACDHAVALLLERSSGDGAAVYIEEVGGQSAADSSDRPARPLAGNQGLADLAIAASRISRGEMAAPAAVYDDLFGGGGYAVTLNR
ncbi:beta-ketoacyl synthase chain length factor, partial [Paenibacillus sp. 598K]|uniref:beta-ketoacyl synthase chain length factor n=1 Tax=Paenibacillus sp. 598K TaxID=1117987 RepID=UPI000FFF28E9